MGGASGRDIVLIGGGLAGGLLATYLGRAGHRVDLYERRPDPESGNLVGGRSINLALSTRGLHALEQVGLAEAVLADAIPMRGRMIHGRDGDLHFQPYDQDPVRCINSVGRAVLNRVTLEAARRQPGVRVHFDHRCLDVDLEQPSATIRPPGGEGAPLVVRGDAVVGVDGAFSPVRRAMQRLDRFDYSQRYLSHGYKELTIPPAEGGGWRMEKHALHIWPRRSFMMIALPNPDGSFTCTLFYPFDGHTSFAMLRGDEEVRALFAREFADAVPLMPTLLEDFRQNPTGSMVTVRCRPWHVGERAVLVGDAAHAVVPFYGQGANAAFEDCVVLDECLRERGWSAAALAEYERRRKPHVDALADLALTNFIEMRDRTGSRAFRAYKSLERTLHRALPGVYTPLYTMVSFTRVPYGDAVQRDRAQWVAVVALALALLMASAWGVAIALGAGVAGGALLAVGLGLLLAALLRRGRRRAQQTLREIGVESL